MSYHHVRSRTRTRTLLLLLSILLTFTFTSAHIETDDAHDMLSMITPLEKVSQYETIPRIIPTSASQTRSNRHPHLLYYEFKAINRTWKVKAELNHDLFAPSYQELVWVNGKGLVPQEGPQSHHDHCYYIGHVTNARNASAYNSASLHTCKGVHGIIHADNMMLHVQPSLTDTSTSIVFLDQHVKRGPRHHKCKHDVDHVEMDITSASASTHMASRQFQSLQNMDLGRTRWVELIIVNDRANFAQFRAGTTKGSSNIANQVDALYANAQLTPPLRVRLVAQITFQDEDPYQKLLAFHPNGEVSVDSLLAAFTKWSADPANNLPPHDNHQLISGLNFENNVVGYAPVSQMCNIQNSAAIVSHATQDWIGTALTSTHEMGHNLGMIHDGLNVAPQGRCPPSGSIMAAQSSPGLNITEFSVCSKLAYQNWYQQDGYRRDPNACLENIPTRAWAVGVCGDGKLEGTEECDCGPANSTECRERQPCCIPETCKFKPGATCAKADACCNIETCQVRPKGTICRAQRDRTCDIVETCDGRLPTCPDDTYQVAGGICNDTYSATGGRCYQGFCLSLDKLCSQFGAYRACPTSLLPDPTATSSCRQSYCLFNGSTTCEAKPDPSKTPGTIPDGYGCDTGKQCMSAKCVTSDQLDHPPVPTAPPTPIGTNGGISNPLTENNNLITILVIIAAVAIALSVLLCVYRRCRRQQAKRDIASGRVRYAAPGVYVDEPGIYVAPPLNQQNIQLNVYNSQPPSNQILSNGLTVEEAMAIQQMQLADAQRAEQMKQEQAAAEAARAREISIEPAEPARPIEFASDEEAIQALLAQEEADRRARDARRAEAGLPPLNEPLSADEKLIRDLLAKDAEALKAREARRTNGGGSVTKPKNIPVVPTIVATPAPTPAPVPISFSPAPAPAGAPGGISIAAANDLPRGWTEHKTSQGVQYWFNSVTGKTAWSRPTE